MICAKGEASHFSGKASIPALPAPNVVEAGHAFKILCELWMLDVGSFCTVPGPRRSTSHVLRSQMPLHRRVDFAGARLFGPQSGFLGRRWTVVPSLRTALTFRKAVCAALRRKELSPFWIFLSHFLEIPEALVPVLQELEAQHVLCLSAGKKLMR